MSVASGYGSVVTSGSAFMYDTGDTYNSYIGEPTTNLALFSVISGITFNADYGGTISQTADYTVTYQGRPSLKVVSISQWNIYKYPRPGNYTATNSTAFTFSWKMKWSDGRVPVLNNGYIYTDAQYFYPSVTVTAIEDGWYFCQCNTSGTNSPLWLTGFDCSQIGTCYITDWQAEANSHATQFTAPGTTRSVTQGLLPIVGNSTINLSTVSFTSAAQMTFDGTDDRITLTPSNYGITNQFTIEVICNPTQVLPTGMFNFLGTVGDRGIMCHWPWTDGNIYFDVYNTSGTFHRWYKTISIVNQTALYHIMINSSGQMIVKQNNVVLSPNDASTFSGTVAIGSSNTIGAFNSSGALPWAGNIYMFKVYNRALTDTETTQNYNKYKTRFNLS